MNLFALFASIVCFGRVWCAFKLQILHTNDMHAHFAEVDAYASSCPPDDAKAGKCYGGFARIRRAAVEAADEARKQNVSSIFLNAGDTFQGTPYYTVYKWRVAASIINTLNFDVMCLGNHEFDDGIDNLVEYLAHAKTPTVAANLNRTSEMKLNHTNVKDSVVLNVTGVTIGVVGYLTPDTMTTSSAENLHIFEEIPSIRTEAKRLKSQGVKVIIGLGHSGLAMDKKIAEQVEEIDLIVGGHSHSLLYAPTDKQPSTETIDESYPCWVTQKSGKRVPIVQSSAFTKYFGRLMVTFDDNYKIIAAEGNSHLLTSKHKKDDKVEHLVNSWRQKLQGSLSKVVGNTRVMLKKSDLKNNEVESNIANLVTDSILNAGVLQAAEKNCSQWTEHSVAIYQSGGIRSQIDNQKSGGNFTLEDVLMVLPFQNKLCQCRLMGEDLKKVLEHSVIRYEPNERNLKYFLHFSGLRVTFDLKRPPGDRVVSVMVLCANCSVPQYEILDMDRKYLLLLNDYLLRGGDDFHVLKTQCMDAKCFQLVESDMVVEFIRKREIIYPILDGRVKVSGYGSASMAINKKSSLYMVLPTLLLVWVRRNA